MNRQKRRSETRKNQAESRKIGTLHPRSLARSIVHKRMERSDMFGVNKVHPGQTQSYFARAWRNDAVGFANEKG